MPLRVSVLLLSQPLHFGDHGGLPLKIIWPALDLAAVAVLTLGLYLFLRRGAKNAGPIAKPTRAAQMRPLRWTRLWMLRTLIALASAAGIVTALLAPAAPARWLALFLALAPVKGGSYAWKQRRSGR